jgi:dienelactone hydrolase
MPFPVPCRPRRSWFVQSFAAAFFALGGSGQAAAVLAVPPLPLPGPYAVACSNVVQDFTRLAPGEDVQAIWEGVPRADGSPRYITDLLADAANTLAVTVNAPNDGSLYGSFAGRSVPYVVLVCHPSAAADPRPAYALPTGKVVPHMQRGAEPPLWPETATRYPILLFSHGYIGSPLSNDYINAIAILASFGYVVAAPFHGDGRFTATDLESLDDVIYLFTHLTDFVAMQALRPLSLSATLDMLLEHPQWRDRVDPARIGGFGASMGGESMMLMAGAGLTKTFGQSWSQVTHDPRLKAAAGYVPYFGQPGLPAFGRGGHGLDGITLPYLAISGTADTTAPILQTLEGMNRLAGTRELVALVGVKHGFDIPSTDDIFTWTVTFLDAEVRGDPAARDRLSRMTSVAGGGNDIVVLPYNAPAPPNFGGLWWNAPAGSESGWGLTFAHQGDVIFTTWFTYDAQGEPWWLIAELHKTAEGVYSGPVSTVTGPPFNAVPWGTRNVVETVVGAMTATFADTRHATVAYTVNGIAQTKAIVPQEFGPRPTCTWGAEPDLARATNFQDLWWSAPPGSEPGWGVTFTHQGDIIFATWLTYDAQGRPWWLIAELRRTTGNACAGPVSTVTGPPFNAVPWDRTRVVEAAVGAATVSFADGNNATFAYTVSGMAQTKRITRQVFSPPGIICR